MASENRRAWDPDDKRYARMAEKKNHIMQVAQGVFIRNGYERTSMDAIAKEANVGKMTVYRQFADKQTLFIACMNDQCSAMLTPDTYPVAQSLAQAEQILIQYGHVIVDLITQKEIVSLYRMLIGETNHFDGLGALFYQGGPSQAINVIEKVLAKLFGKREARLRAQTFFWSSLGDTYERVVLGVVEAVDVRESFDEQIKFAAGIALR